MANEDVSEFMDEWMGIHSLYHATRNRVLTELATFLGEQFGAPLPDRC